MYTWGAGFFGMLGHGNTDSALAPTLVQGALLGAMVMQVSAGDYHTACITEEGALYTWGAGDYGMLGHGNEDSVMVPTLVQGALLGATVMQVSAGAAHTACITEEGALYTWGHGDYGRLGQGNTENAEVPTLVQGALLGATVMQVSAGTAHTACITEEGVLYTWGGGSHGRLGHGSENSAEVPTLVQGALLGATVMQVSAGNRCTACIAEDGALYTWGYGDGGMLGRGNEDDTNVPTLVQGVLLGARVT